MSIRETLLKAMELVMKNADTCQCGGYLGTPSDLVDALIGHIPDLRTDMSDNFFEIYEECPECGGEIYPKSKEGFMDGEVASCNDCGETFGISVDADGNFWAQDKN